MIVSKIPGIEEDFEEVRSIGPTGFVLAINVKWTGPEFLHSEFPKRWRKLYEAHSYFMFDPIYYWTVTKTGQTRWSEVRLPDPRGIGSKAAEFGLVYGATISRKRLGKKSFLSVGRADREVTEPEFFRLNQIFEKWLDVVSERPVLEDGEFEVLSFLREGFEQKEIAVKLGLSVSTVKNRLKSIRRKFDSQTTAEALSIAVEKKYFDGS